MKAKLFLLALALFCFAAMANAVAVGGQCVPESCPTGYSDEGITCIGNECTRSCSIQQQVCSSGWQLAWEKAGKGFSTGNSDATDVTAGYTVKDGKCYLFALNTPNNLELTVNENECIAGKKNDGDAIMVAGLKGNSKKTSWLASVPAISGQEKWYGPDVKTFQNKGSFVTSFEAAGGNFSSQNKTNFANDDTNVYCAPSREICNSSSLAQCGTGCKNEKTLAFAQSGYFKKTGDGIKPLLDDLECSNNRTTKNTAKTIKLRVYSSSVVTAKTYSNKNCTAVAQCSAGACCESNGVFSANTKACSQNSREEFYCRDGEGAGKSIYKKIFGKNCSGNSDGCDGSEFLASDSLLKPCGAQQNCANGQSECIDACTEEYIPVCGTDGNTYTNECRMRQAGAAKAYDGECRRVAAPSGGCIENSECDSGKFCVAGQCIAISCSIDSDCGIESYSAPHCTSGNVYKKVTSGKCNNAGTESAACSTSDNEVLVESCNAGCLDGACLKNKGVMNPEIKVGGKTIWTFNGAFDSNKAVEFKAALEEAMKNCSADGSGNCRITISGKGTGMGQISLSKLLIKFKKAVTECSSKADCGTDGYVGQKTCSGKNVQQAYRTFSCSNPGTVSSKCNYSDETKTLETCSFQCESGACQSPPSCSTNAECGTDGFTGAAFCIDSNVFQNYITFTCNSPGTSGANCSSATAPRLKQTCPNGCTAGICNPAPVRCYINSDCGTDAWTGSASCSNNDVFQAFREFRCNNPGIPAASCSSTDTNRLKQDCGDTSYGTWGANVCDSNNVVKSRIVHNKGCSNGACTAADTNETQAVESCAWGCSNGACLPEPSTCSSNADCGTDGYIGAKYCSAKIVKQTYRSFTCQNPGRVTSRCIVNDANNSVESCANACENGACINPVCDSNADCAADAYIGSAFCLNDDTFKTYRDYFCGSPGTSQAACLFFDSNRLQSDCGTTSYGAWDSNSCDANNVVKTRTVHNRGCSIGACYLTDTTEKQTLQTCEIGCSSGRCATYACGYDSDCGTNGYIGGKFCADGDAKQVYRTFDCENPRTAQARCTFADENRLSDDCGTTTFGAWSSNTCDGNSVVKTRTAHNKGCNVGACYNNDTVERQTIDVCPNGCVSGACRVACNADSDCGTDSWINSPRCSSGNVYQDFKTYSCNSPRTPSSTCSSQITSRYKEGCAKACENGACINPSCMNDSECGADGYIGAEFCSNNDVFKTYRDNYCTNPGTSQAACQHTDTNNLRNDCGNTTFGAWSANTCDGNTVVKTRTAHNKGCSAAACTSSDTVETQVVESCALGCSAGRCTYACYDNSDCGTDGYITSAYCADNDVKKTFRTYACSNPNTPAASCGYSDSVRLTQECGDTTYDPWTAKICDGNQIIKRRDVHNKGCSAGACTNLTTQERQVIQLCPFGCASGNCFTPECFTNSDCGTDHWTGSSSCNFSDVYQPWLSYTCTNPGAINANCESLTRSIFKQDCLESSTGAWGASYCNGRKVQKDRTANSRGCSSGICYDNPSTETLLVTTCQFSCVNGACTTADGYPYLECPTSPIGRDYNFNWLQGNPTTNIYLRFAYTASFSSYTSIYTSGISPTPVSTKYDALVHYQTDHSTTGTLFARIYGMRGAQSVYSNTCEFSVQG